MDNNDKNSNNLKKGSITVGGIIALVIAILTGTNIYAPTYSAPVSDTPPAYVQEVDVSEEYSDKVYPEMVEAEVIEKEEVTNEEATVAEEIQKSEEAEEYKARERKYTFKNDELKNQHYEKHGIEMGFASADEYEQAASLVVNNPNALHKIEAEDGDDVYYLKDTNEFVIVSTKGFIRTYYNPRDGIRYFNRQ